MKHKQLSVVIALLASGHLVLAQGTSFTYQGRLNEATLPATGVYDVRFSLWSGAIGGIQIGGTVALDDVPVVNGLFTVFLDFGAEAFQGSERWLQIAVRPGTSAGAYTTLTPRTPVLPSPYAIYAGNATTADSAGAAAAVPWGGITEMPVVFRDNEDNDTQYSAGAGLSLAGTTFSLNATYTDDRYVNRAGDVMTGALTTPNLTVPGTVTTQLIDSFSSALSVTSDSNIELHIDYMNRGDLIGSFTIFNGNYELAFFVNEYGDSHTFGDQYVHGTVTAASFTGNGAGLTTAGLVRATVLNVDCGSNVAYSTAFTKLANIGTFSKEQAGSTIEVTFNGRVYVHTMETVATGAQFELRVDDAATTNGRARSNLRRAEIGGGTGIQTSITGIFTGLGAGTHTVSMWIKGVHGGGTGAILDPGCYGTDHVVVKELK